MEVITGPVDENRIHEMARAVFEESIALLGGLPKLVEYRNLTWLPSLAEAAYVIVLSEEGKMTHKEIAAKLGLTDQTVANILRADPELMEKFLRGEMELKEVETHKAGAIAKVAYQRLKSRGFEAGATYLDVESAKVLEILWAFNVLSHLKGVHFPADKETLKERLAGLKVKGRPIEELLEKIPSPVKSPAELLHKLKEAASA